MSTAISAIRLGEIFKDSIDFLKKYFLLVVGSNVVMQLMSYMQSKSFVDPSKMEYWASFFLLLFVESYIAFAILLYIDSREERRAITYQEALKKAKKRIIPGLAVLVITVVLAVIGTLFLIIPGIFVLIFLANSNYFVVLESKGVFQSFVLSERLVKGNEWRVLVLYILFFVPFFAFAIWLQGRFGDEASYIVGFIPGVFAVGLFYCLWRALRKANPSVS